MITPWIQTWSGQAIDILRPDAAEIRLVDIAASLSGLARFNGHTRFVWSVASHCLLAESLLPRDTDPEARLHVLLHDAHEMVTGDIVSPMKVALTAMAGLDVVALMSRKIQAAIHLAAGVGCDARMRELTKLMDLTALAIEKHDLLTAEPRRWQMPLPDISGIVTRIVPESRPIASRHFIERCRMLIRASDVMPMPSFLEGTA